MPLMILGLLLLIGLLGYSVISYMNSVQVDDRPVRERYPHAFPARPASDESAGNNADSDAAEDKEDPPVDAESYYEEDSFKGDLDYMIRNIKEDLKQKAESFNIDLDSIAKKFSSGRSILDDEEEEDNTVEFPKDNIENEKKKRGINSD